jgi:hypothetical protein
METKVVTYFYAATVFDSDWRIVCMASGLFSALPMQPQDWNQVSIDLSGRIIRGVRDKGLPWGEDWTVDFTAINRV